MAEAPRQPADDLVASAQARFGELSHAELELLRRAPEGEIAFCGPAPKDDDPAKADEWGTDRQIRADLVRWLCVDREAVRAVDPKGIQVHAAKITGALDLEFATISFPLKLCRCRLTEDANLPSISLPFLNLSGSRVQSVIADGADVKGGVFLRDGFSAEGEVRLPGARIAGDVDCSGGTFKDPGRYALSADRADVKGSVLLREGFSAEGGVRLLGAQVGGNLACGGGTFKNPGKDALSADGADVKGCVFLRDGFSAEGTVRLPGARIQGDLDCSRGKFGEVNVETAAIVGTLFWRGAETTEATWLNLTNASAGSLVDDEESWPNKGNLFLDGFVYGHISGESPRDAKTRLRWLERQEHFTPKPYRQLAKVLRETGDDRGARRVLFEMERRRRQAEDRSWYARLWGWVLKWTIGYGFYSWWALGWLVVLTIVGWGLFRHGYFSGAIAPTDKDAYCFFRTQGRPPDYYQRFTASIYSLENSVPLFNLGQKDLWSADPSPRGSRRWADFLRGFRWCQIVLGWLFSTLFVAGVTGVVRRE